MKRLEINNEDLKYNLELIKNRLSSKSRIIAVVKANGMGLGLVEYAKFLSKEGIDFFGVSNSFEAITLRNNGIQDNILMMSELIDTQGLTELIKNDIILTVGNLEEKKLIDDISKNLNKTTKVHIKIDTGFCRFGFIYDDETIFEAIKDTENVKVVGCFTHFSKPIDEKWTRIQFSRFENIKKTIKEINPNIQFHSCNSTAFLLYEDMWDDFVRLGSCIQGRVLVNPLGLKKIGVLKSEIVSIKNIKKGYNISYSNEYKAKKDMKVAIICVGYMDGFNLKKARDSFSFKDNLISVCMEIKKIFRKGTLKVRINHKDFNVVRKDWNVSCNSQYYRRREYKKRL